MKLFGKKTLALFLALAMVMPMCVFANETTTVAATGVTISGGESLYYGQSLDLTATVTPDDATNKNVTWASNDSSIATVSETGKVTAKSKAGDVIITVTALGGASVSAQTTITVETDTIQTVDKIGPVSVAYGTSSSAAATALANAEAEVTYTKGGKGTVKISGWQAPGTYDGTKPGTYEFTTTVDDSVSVSANVTVAKATLTSSTNLGTIAFPLGTDEDDIEDELEDYYDEVSLKFKEFSSSVDFTIGDKSDDDFAWWDAPSSFDEDEAGTYTFTAKVNTSTDNYEKYGLTNLTLSVFIYDEDITVEVPRTGTSLSSVATQLNTILSAVYDDSLETVEIEDLELDGGTLYTSSACDEEYSIDDVLTKSEFSALYYIPNGSGEDSVIEYVAYYDYEDEDEDCIEGRIYLTADEYMMLSYTVSEDDVITLDADEFEEQFLAQNSKYEELSYVTFSFSGSKTKGYLYSDYDEDTEKGTTVKSTTKCYVDPDDGDVGLDDVVFVPGTSMTAGTYTITYTAKGYKSNSSSVQTETGYILITFVETADITIEAGKGETVDVDKDLFQDWLEDEIGGSKTLNIVSVSISGAPRSKTAGYLVTDDDQLTKTGAKVFYADPDDDEYDLDDIQFEGGTKSTTTNGTFKITYTVGTSSTKKTVEGTIDFIVGSSHSLNGSIIAAKVFSFGETANLDAFEELGDNDNVYVEFTSLPKNGKLYYNYGLATQEDVTVGTDYYLTTSSGKKQLRYVTFVPSYSSSKIAQTATFGVKGYNKNDKAVSGTVNIAITYASYSAYFTDVKTSMYADSVDFLYNRGITTGMTTTTFSPDTNVTRGQFVTFLYRAAGSPTVTAANSFTDVTSSDYYYNAVRWAVKEGITNGRSATIFDPNANVTYQEIMTFLYRYDVTYLGHAGTLGSSSYVYDFAKVDTWAQNAVKWAVNKGIFTSGNLNPTTAGTRANVALYMHRMLTL